MTTIGEFHRQMVKYLPPGKVLVNPGGGTTRIKGYSTGRVLYIRGASTIRVAIDDLFLSYTYFSGTCVSSRDLKEYAPEVFSSSARPAGHSCNCTFLFMVLKQLGLADAIGGEGKRGKPFCTTFR